jgi:hypothetical protein
VAPKWLGCRANEVSIVRVPFSPLDSPLLSTPIKHRYIALFAFCFIGCIVFLFSTMAPGFVPPGKRAGVTAAGATLMVTFFALM